jgi:hypothetical protein
MKTVATVTWLPEADATCMRLHAEGIETFIPDQHTVLANAMYGNAIGGVRIQVEERDFARAMEILHGSVPPASPGMFACPACRSDAVTYEKYSRRVAFLMLLFLGIPLLWKKRQFTCQACRHQWKG